MQVIDMQREIQEDRPEQCSLKAVTNLITSLADSEFVIFIPIGGGDDDA